MNFFKFFEEIGDFIYSNDGLSSQQSLDEIVKILFVKIFDLGKENNYPGLISDRINLIFNEVKKTYSDVLTLYILETIPQLIVDTNLIGSKISRYKYKEISSNFMVLNSEII